MGVKDPICITIDMTTAFEINLVCTLGVFGFWETQFMFAQVLIRIKQNKRQMGLES